MLERRLAGGQILRAVLESADIVGHSALTAVRDDGGINLALVNVLDVAQQAISAATQVHQFAESTNPVGGACGDDPERNSNR